MPEPTKAKPAAHSEPDLAPIITNARGATDKTGPPLPDLRHPKPDTKVVGPMGTTAKPDEDEKKLLDKQITHLKDQTQEVSPEMKPQEPPLKAKPAKAKMAELPKLQPGEIYIDEDGIIHQAEAAT